MTFEDRGVDSSWNQLIEFWRKLYVIHYDNRNQGFTRLSILKKHYWLTLFSNSGTGKEENRFLVSKDAGSLFYGIWMFWILDMRSKEFLMENGD
jgi:hypothetical protein